MNHFTAGRVALRLIVITFNDLEEYQTATYSSFGCLLFAVVV